MATANMQQKRAAYQTPESVARSNRCGWRKRSEDGDVSYRLIALRGELIFTKAVYAAAE